MFCFIFTCFLFYFIHWKCKAFDIVVGCPPGSYVSTNETTLEQEKTNFRILRNIKKIGEIIQKIQRTQDKKLYYLLECPMMYRNHDPELLLAFFESAYSVVFDSADISPCLGKCTYISNIPLILHGHDENAYKNECDIGHLSKIEHCLQDNFIHPKVFEDNKHSLMYKSDCFIAHPSFIDDDRMLVCKLKDSGNHQTRAVSSKRKKYICRYLTTPERESLKGLPMRYVEEARKYMAIF